MPLPEPLERLQRDCTVTAYKSSGPGGQKKNKTASSVRVVHRPTGIVRIATESRSQLRNREAALERVWKELRRRAHRPTPRVASRPTKSSVEKRLAEKKRRAEKKRTRGVAEE